MWKCPACGRRFKNTSQPHSCRTYTLEYHLWNKPPRVVALYQLLAELLTNLGAVEIVPMKSSILFRGESIFCTVVVGAEHLKVRLQLDRETAPEQGWAVTEVSANRYVYEVSLRDPAQLDENLRDLLAEAASLSGVQDSQDSQ